MKKILMAVLTLTICACHSESGMYNGYQSVYHEPQSASGTTYVVKESSSTSAYTLQNGATTYVAQDGTSTTYIVPTTTQSTTYVVQQQPSYVYVEKPKPVIVYAHPRPHIAPKPAPHHDLKPIKKIKVDPKKGDKHPEKKPAEPKKPGNPDKGAHGHKK